MEVLATCVRDVDDLCSLVFAFLGMTTDRSSDLYCCRREEISSSIRKDPLNFRIALGAGLSHLNLRPRLHDVRNVVAPLCGALRP